MDLSRIRREREGAHKFGQIRPSTKDNGNKTVLREEANLHISMETIMMDNGRTMRLTDMAFINKKVAAYMKDSGVKIFSMARGRKLGLTEVISKDNMLQDWKMALESTYGLTETLMRAIGRITTIMEKGLKSYLMEDLIMEIGWMAACTVEGHINGQTDNSTRGNTRWIISRAMVAISGKTERDTSGNGRITRGTERAV